MTVVYAYRYGIVGGVSTQLRLRQAALAEVGVRCVLFFSQDNGLGGVLTAASEVIFGSDMSLSALVRRERPEAVIVVDSPELLGPGAGAWRSPARVYLDVHTTTRTGLGYLREVNLRRVAGIMVPSGYSRSILLSHLPDARVHVVPNVLDTDAFSPGPCDRRPADGVREFVWVGKLDNHKRWRLALIYARLLQNLLGAVRLTIVGGYTAPEARTMEFFELAHRLGISRIVRWLDRVDNSAMPGVYRQCAASGGAMIVTSRDESFGMSAGEALLCGCPLIGNDLPVFREVLPVSDMIRLIDVWQPDEFANAVLDLADAPMSSDEIARVVDHLGSRFGYAAFREKLQSTLACAR